MKTMKAICESLEQLTAQDGGHLPEPGTVIVGTNHATIMPELPGAPISGLLVWAMHLEGAVSYQAEILFRGEVSTTSVTATGQINGVDVTLLATTYRPMAKLLDYPTMTKVACTELELRELASNEAVLGKL